MNPFLILTLAFAWLVILSGSWLGWQLVRQNGRMLLRLDDLEKRLNELEFGATISRRVCRWAAMRRILNCLTWRANANP